MVDPVTHTITPFKGERTLKRPATEVTHMEIDTTTKKPRVSTKGKEIVTMVDDVEDSINQTKGIPITEEHSHSKESSHPASPSLTHFAFEPERKISQMITTEQSSNPVIDIQQFVFDTESSLYESKWIWSRSSQWKGTYLLKKTSS